MMWVPWKAGNPGQQGRGSRGTMTHAQAVAKSRTKQRKDAFAKLKKGKITPAQYERILRRIGS